MAKAKVLCVFSTSFVLLISVFLTNNTATELDINLFVFIICGVRGSATLRDGGASRTALWWYCFAKSAALAERGTDRVLYLFCRMKPKSTKIWVMGNAVWTQRRGGSESGEGSRGRGQMPRSCNRSTAVSLIFRGSSMDCPLPEKWSEGPKFTSRGASDADGADDSPHWEVVLGVLHMVW